MAFVVTKGKQVRPLRAGDLKEVAERDERIRQLEQLDATLAAQVDRMRPVVAVAEAIAEHGMSMARYNDLRVVVYKYHTAMAQLAKDG